MSENFSSTMPDPGKSQLQSVETKTNWPLVSVVMPAYNHAAYVREALLSVSTQTYPEIELIIIDDGSQDETALVIEGTLAKIERHMRVVFKKQTNVGICKTLNRALALCGGEFVQFLASDDAYLPDKTARSMAALSAAAPEVAAVYCDGYLFDENSRRHGIFSDKYRVPLGRNLYRELLIANWLPAMGILYRRDALTAIGGFDPDLKFEDWDLLLRLAKNYKIKRIPDKLFLYRVHSSNMTKNSALMRETVAKIARKHVDMRMYQQLKADIQSNPASALFRHRANLDLIFRSLGRKVFTNRGIQGDSMTGTTVVLANLLISRSTSITRTILCRLFGVRLGRRCKVGGRLKIRGNRRNLQIGSGVNFEGDAEFVLPRGIGQGCVSIGDGCVIASGAVFQCLAGEMVLGGNSFVGRNVVLQSNGDLRIGDWTLIAANAGVYASIPTTAENDQPLWKQDKSLFGVTIGENCWIGHEAVVVHGAELGPNSIVGPNSVVRGVHGPNSMVTRND